MLQRSAPAVDRLAAPAPRPLRIVAEYCSPEVLGMGRLANTLLVAGPVLLPGVRLYRGVRLRAAVFSHV
jgi:hypothetical protein